MCFVLVGEIGKRGETYQYWLNRGGSLVIMELAWFPKKTVVEIIEFSL